METGSDQKRTDLPAFIPDEYENYNFRDIVIAKWRENGQKSLFHTLNHTNVTYFPLHYVFFQHKNPVMTQIYALLYAIPNVYGYVFLPF